MAYRFNQEKNICHASIGMALWAPCCWCGLFLLGLTSPSLSHSKANVVTVPLSLVNVDDATATISVMDEPLSSFSVFLESCQAGLTEDLGIQDKDISHDMKTFCEMAEKFSKHYLPPPTQHPQTQGICHFRPFKRTLQWDSNLALEDHQP